MPIAVDIEKEKADAWSFLRQNPEAHPHQRLAAACRVVGAHFNRSCRGGRAKGHPEFDRYARAYDAEHTFVGAPDVLPGFRALYPQEPHANLPLGKTVWEQVGG